MRGKAHACCQAAVLSSACEWWMDCLVLHGACSLSMLQHGPSWVHIAGFKLLNDSTVTVHWAPDETQTRHATRPLQDCTKNHSEDLGEAVPEALKNMLLVMGARGVLKPDWKVGESAAPAPQLAQPVLAGWDCIHVPCQAGWQHDLKLSWGRALTCHGHLRGVCSILSFTPTDVLTF